MYKYENTSKLILKYPCTSPTKYKNCQAGGIYFIYFDCTLGKLLILQNISQLKRDKLLLKKLHKLLLKNLHIMFSYCKAEMKEMVVMEYQVLEVSLEEMVRQETLDHRDLLDPRQEGSLMSGGVEPPALIQRELN